MPYSGILDISSLVAQNKNEHQYRQGLLGSVALVVVLSACGGESPTPPASGPLNAAPEVAANAQLTQEAILQLTGSAFDETLPGGELTTEWTQVSGPGPVTFADPSKVDTTATFTAAGTY